MPGGGGGTKVEVVELPLLRELFDNNPPILFKLFVLLWKLSLYLLSLFKVFEFELKYDDEVMLLVLC